MLASLRIGDAQPVTDPASIKGKIEVPPFVIAEATGLGALILPEFDAEIDLPVQNLDFLTLLTGDMAGLDLKGQGRLRGRLVFSHGELLPGTDLIVEAHELAMTLARHAFNGDGTIELKVDPDDADQADLVVRFDEVQASLLAEHPGAATEAGETPALTLFSGHGLEALLHIETRGGKPDLNLTLNLPAMEVPDLRVYNRLLPDEWGMRLLGGSGRVNGQVVVAPETMRFELDLASDQAHLSYRDYQATTDLSLQLRARIASAPDRRRGGAGPERYQATARQCRGPGQGEDQGQDEARQGTDIRPSPGRPNWQSTTAISASPCRRRRRPGARCAPWRRPWRIRVSGPCSRRPMAVFWSP